MPRPCSTCNTLCEDSPLGGKVACSVKCREAWLTVNVPGMKWLPEEKIPQVTKAVPRPPA